MIKFVLFGLWSCVVAVGTAYLGLMWSQEVHDEVKAAAKSVKLTHVGIRQISVPISSDGQVKGYVVAKIGYVARADDLKKLEVKPEVFLFDAVFSAVFERKVFDLTAIDQNTLAEFLQHVKAKVNAHLGSEVVLQVVAEELGYVPFEQARGRTAASSAKLAPSAGSR